jgi:hypothetical protein
LCIRNMLPTGRRPMLWFEKMAASVRDSERKWDESKHCRHFANLLAREPREPFLMLDELNTGTKTSSVLGSRSYDFDTLPVCSC